MERVKEGRSLLMLFHLVAGRAVNRSLAWVLAYRLRIAGSVVANHDDHAFLLSVSRRDRPGEDGVARGLSSRSVSRRPPVDARTDRDSGAAVPPGG